MIAFILWFCVLVGLCKVTQGWTRAILVLLYLFGSILVAL